MKFFPVFFAVVYITIACAPHKPKSPKPKPATEPVYKCAEIVYNEAECKARCGDKCICGSPSISKTKVKCPSSSSVLVIYDKDQIGDFVSCLAMNCNEKTGQWEFNGNNYENDAKFSEPSVSCLSNP